MDSNHKHNFSTGASCPVPIDQYPQVLLAHGGGGKLMQKLIKDMFRHTFDNPPLNQQHDGAILSITSSSLAFTTDSYVIDPLFFPGGDIGSLAVHGTVNDLAMCGARPLYLSAGFIIEEGLAMETLWRIVQSMQQAARISGVEIVTGDTKVVDKGKGDGIFINTAGVGAVEHHLQIDPRQLQLDDVILVSGDIGRHGIAIMAVREGLEFETTIESDSAPVADVVMQLVDAGIDIHCLRDLTRGGLAGALIEIATVSQLNPHLQETAIPVRDDVYGACELLGLDPLYVANEGRFIAIVPPVDAERALKIMETHPVAAGSAIIGTVKNNAPGLLTMTGKIGVNRVLDLPTGEQLPRIC